MNKSLFTVALLCALSGVASAQFTIYEQSATTPPDPLLEDLGSYSNRTVTTPDDEEVISYDNFTLGLDAEINQLMWAGTYETTFPTYDPNEPEPETNFRVKIYGAEPTGFDEPALFTAFFDGGLPGVSSSEVMVTDLGHTDLPPDPSLDPGPAFMYSADLAAPWSLAAGDYWISIQALQTFPTPEPSIDPQWRWHIGNGPNDGFLQFDKLFPGTGGDDVKDLAFTLKGVPEPSSALLGLCGLASLGLIRRKRG